MNKRIAKKRTTPSFWQRIAVDSGATATVHVNRRGCTGAWTKQDGEALQAIVRAAHAQMSAQPPQPRTTTNGE